MILEEYLVLAQFLDAFHRDNLRMSSFQEVEGQPVGNPTEPGRERSLAGIVAVDAAKGTEEAVLQMNVRILLN